MTYLFRVEAVNFQPTILDTNDLSTIRGMGLEMLESPVRTVDGFRKVYSGASIALWEIEAKSLEDAKAKAGEYEVALCTAPGGNEGGDLTPHREEAHRHITFVWDMASEEQGFEAAHRDVIAGCRWKQMEQPTLMYPQVPEKVTRVCDVDGLRPATQEEQRPEGRTRWVSPFTFSRRQLGLADRHVKERFYAGYVHAQDAPDEYVSDLDQLTDYRGFGARLRHKMAVIHLDGNHFGKRTVACTDAGQLGSWSSRLKGEQDIFLQKLVRVKDEQSEEEDDFTRTPWRWSGKQVSNQGFEHVKNSAWRMEVLLWGGDEITVVVPAWTGWWTLAKILAAKANANVEDPLSYGAGIVFCHHKAPIRRVRHLAHMLAERVKAADRTKSLCAYQVLESFDDLGLDPDATLDRLVRPAGLTNRDLVIDANSLEPMLTKAKLLHECIPKSKAYEVVRLILDGKDEEAKKLIGKTIKKANEEAGAGLEDGIEVFKLAAKEEPSLGKSCKAGWLNLVELWDYLPEPKWSDPFKEGQANA